jgi:predicted metal-dependent hydrolase
VKSRIYNIDDIGNIEVCKHHNSKKITIKIKNGSLPRVIIPNLMTYNTGYKFAVEKKNWIIKTLKKVEKNNSITVFDESTLFKTRFHTIIFRQQDIKSIKVKEEKSTVSILIPKRYDITSEIVQTSIKKIIIEILRFEAKNYLPERVKKLAEQYGFSYNKVYIKNLKSKWGSCSYQNNINLNLHLMKMPEYLSDFIILHELCHTVFKNHGKQFHELLNKITRNEKLLNKKLKKYSTIL